MASAMTRIASPAAGFRAVGGADAGADTAGTGERGTMRMMVTVSRAIILAAAANSATAASERVRRALIPSGKSGAADALTLATRYRKSMRIQCARAMAHLARNAVQASKSLMKLW